MADRFSPLPSLQMESDICVSFSADVDQIAALEIQALIRVFCGLDCKFLEVQRPVIAKRKLQDARSDKNIHGE